MLKVAVTGGIGTGKSVVLTQLAACGAPVVDADAVVHECLRAGTAAAAAIRARFGEAVMAASGDVDRARLGAIVFQDERRDETSRPSCIPPSTAPSKRGCGPRRPAAPSLP